MRSPIEQMIDAAVRCLKCGAKMGQCDCWAKITLRCPECHRTQKAEKDATDPAGTAVVEVVCEKCHDGVSQSEVRYYDKDGRWWDGEKFRRTGSRKRNV